MFVVCLPLPLPLHPTIVLPPPPTHHLPTHPQARIAVSRLAHQLCKRSSGVAGGLGAGSSPKERALLATALVHLLDVRGRLAQPPPLHPYTRLPYTRTRPPFPALTVTEERPRTSAWCVCWGVLLGGVSAAAH